jgi:hypothetical protein
VEPAPRARDSPHGFNCYYTGLSPGAFKQQPVNYFPQADPDAYATDYATFLCDTATGMETQAEVCRHHLLPGPGTG